MSGVGEVCRPPWVIHMSVFSSLGPGEKKMDDILTQIYIKFQLIKEYLHANNWVSIFCIKNCEFMQRFDGTEIFFNIAKGIFFLLLTLNYSWSLNIVQMANTHNVKHASAERPHSHHNLNINIVWLYMIHNVVSIMLVGEHVVNSYWS